MKPLPWKRLQELAQLKENRSSCIIHSRKKLNLELILRFEKFFFSLVRQQAADERFALLKNCKEVICLEAIVFEVKKNMEVKKIF